MGEDESSYLNYVNVSGFPFQLAVEYEVNKSKPNHRWEVVGREHYWKDSQGGKDGFIDLILENIPFRAIIECKRQLEKSWIFLVPSDSKEESNTTLLWSKQFDSNAVTGGKAYKAWDNLKAAPLSFTSAFCTMQGQSTNDKPMLERVASEVLLMAESLAEEESDFVKSRRSLFPVVYVPIIVTTAKLLICKFKEPDIEIQTGTLPKEKVEFIEIPFIRFQKGLQSNVDSGYIDMAKITETPTSLSELNKFGQRSVFVVQAKEIASFLSHFSLQPENPMIDYQYPWKIIENVIQRLNSSNI